jgi:hypothetical protein
VAAGVGVGRVLTLAVGDMAVVTGTHRHSDMAVMTCGGGWLAQVSDQIGGVLTMGMAIEWRVMVVFE